MLLLGCREKERAPDPPPAASVAPVASKTEDAAQAAFAPFVEMYVAGWSLRDRPAPSFDGVTDAILFSLLPKPDGSLDASTNGLSGERVAAVTKAARARGARVLVAVGGERTAKRFEAPRLAGALATWVKAHDLDGVVLDVEPLAVLAPETLIALARDVKRAIEPRLVTAVVAPDTSEIARLAPLVDVLDRVTVMSYLGEPPPEKEDALVEALVAQGWDRGKIGLGIGPRTLIEARRSRIARAGERRVGGIALWGIMDAGGLRP